MGFFLKIFQAVFVSSVGSHIIALQYFLATLVWTNRINKVSWIGVEMSLKKKKNWVKFALWLPLLLWPRIYTRFFFYVILLIQRRITWKSLYFMTLINKLQLSFFSVARTVLFTTIGGWTIVCPAWGKVQTFFCLHTQT